MGVGAGRCLLACVLAATISGCGEEEIEAPTEEETGRYLKLIVVDTGKGKAGIIVKRIIGQRSVSSSSSATPISPIC